MSKHTPGPWYIEAFDDARATGGRMLSIQTVERLDEEAPTDPTIAGIYNGCAPALANARLIAQAPALLADLTDAAAQLRKYETLHRAKQGELSTELADMNAALAARFEATIAAAVGGAE